MLQSLPKQHTGYLFTAGKRCSKRPALHNCFLETLTQSLLLSSPHDTQSCGITITTVLGSLPAAPAHYGSAGWGYVCKTEHNTMNITYDLEKKKEVVNYHERSKTVLLD